MNLLTTKSSLLTIKEAARILKVNEKTLRRWEAKDLITPIRTNGKHRRYSIEQIKEVKKSKGKKNIENFVSNNITTEIDQVFAVSKEQTNTALEVEYVVKTRSTKKTSLSHVFIGYLMFALFSLGGYTTYKVKSDQLAKIPGFVSKIEEQAVLAATSFQNAEFGINLPTIFSSTLTIGKDTFSDITGDGLSIVDGALTSVNPLGEDVTSSEIVDGTISEVDLLSSNTASGSQFLSFNSTTGGFTWATPTDTVGTNYFTDGGDVTYLTNTDDDFALGGTGSSAKLFFDTSSGNLSISDLTINSIVLDAVGSSDVTSGASLIGVYDEFTNSSGATLQNVLNDLDAAIGAGSFTSFTLSGDAGSDQTITNANTVEIAGGTNGIDTVGTATDTITLNLDTTEIGTNTFGSGSGITWTFDAGVTDPTIAFTSGLISIGGSQFTVDTTNGNLTSAGDIAINGGDITSSGDLTITPTGGDIFFFDGTTLNIGGNGTDVAYNAIGDTTSGASVNVNSDDDLYIEGNLEVDGALYAGGVDISTFVCPDCIDFDDMEDTLDLDTALTLNQGTSTWTQNFSGTTTTGLTYNANSLTTGSAINITTSSNPASTGPVSVNQINATSTNATTATTLAILDIGFISNPGIAGNTEYVLQVQNDVTSNTTDNAVTGLLRIDNADTGVAGSTVATNGLLITNSGDIAGGITNAINIDDIDITTDIVLQNDETIDNNSDGTVLITSPSTSLSGDLAVQGGDITLNTAGTIIPSASGTITIGNSNLTALTITTDGTGDAEVVLPTGSISGTEILDSTVNEIDLNATNSPTSAYILSYDVGGGFTWISNTGGTGASKFTDSGTLTYLTDSTDSITIGSSTELAKLAVDGDANEIQLLVQGNATQTANLFVAENSSGVDFFVIEDLGGLAITPSSTDDVTITTDADSTVVITGLASGSGSALCLDGTNNVVTCTAGSGSSTLQSAYDADTNGSDTLITLSANDDSIIFRNPASSGTDSAFNFQVDNIATGVTTNNFKNLNITEAGTFNTTAGSLTNYAGYITNTSTESAGANVLTNVGLYVTSTGGDTNYSGIFEAGNFGIGDTSPASLFTVGATDAFQVNSSGNIVAIGGASHSISNSTGNLIITPSGSGNTTLGSTTTTSGTTIQSGTGDITFASQDDFIFTPIDGSEIDITAIASTTIEGVIDLNVDTSVTGGFEITNLGLTVNNGATAGDDFTANLVTLIANDADADLFGIQINSSATVNASAGSYEALVRLDNAENTIGAVTDSILITSSSGTDADITDAIDVSHTNIVNAINVGANVIIGTTSNIDLSNFDVTGSNGNIVTAGDIAINGGDITSSGDLTITPAGGDLFLSDGTTLNIGGNATDVAYNIIGDNNTGASASMTSDDDLYIEGFLEVDSGVILSPDSTNDISFVTDADSTLNVTGLSAGVGNALCLDGSNNVVTCTVGSGGVSGSGTAGQVAFFDTASNITSETSGFGWDSTNNLFTITAGTGNTTQTAQTISSTAQGLTSGGLLSGTLTNTSATASFTGDILGISSNRDNDTALQTLTDTGNLVAFGRTTTTNNASATTNVTGALLNVTNTVTATLGTIADSANLISVTQDADATGALVYLNTNRSSTGTALLIEQSAGGTDILQVQDNGNLTILGTVTDSNSAVTIDDDLTITTGTTISASSVTTFNCTDCINFDDFVDILNVDAATDINLGAFALTIDLDSTGDFSIRDVATDIALFADSGAITFAPTAGTAFLTNLGVGSNVQIATTANPTADLTSITNAGFGTVTNGVDGISLTFVTGDGTDPTNNGINLALTSGGTTATDILNGINFGLTGTSGTERGVNFSDNNFDTDINATTDLTLGIGGTNEIILTGTNLSASTAEGNSLGSATLEWEQVFVGDDNGISFGLDQDWTLGYDELTDDRLELVTAGTSGLLVQSATATGTAFNLIDNAITTGTILQTESTSTALTTAGNAFLGYFNWNPGSATTATGDLFRINIGASGNVTNLFNVTDNGSSLFRISETQIESALPHSFSAVGDVNVAYDLVFTNQTSSTIDSYGPLTIRSGESFESNNLTLTSYLAGNILLNTGVSAGKVGIGANVTPQGLLHVSNTGSIPLNAALAIFDNDENQDILTASQSGVTKFILKDIATNFGGLAETGAFVDLNSYLGQEFNFDNQVTPLAADNATGIGDDNTWYFDLVDASSTYSTPADQANGFARLISTTTVTDTANLIGYGNTQNDLNANFLKANLPVMQAKIKISSNDAGNDVFYGLMDQATAVAVNDTKPANGIYFWNNNAAGAWQGVVRSGGVDVGTATCPGAVSTTQFATARIETLSATSVRFMIDNDASDGVKLLPCGTVSGANPTAALGIAFYSVHTGTTALNYDLDYVRTWQDDTGIINTNVTNPTPTEEAPAENILTREEIEELLRITEQNQQLLEESQNWNTNTATSSAEFSELITDDLFVTGIAALNSLSVTESVTLGNNLVIADGNIDTLTTPLNIQGSGTQPLNFMAGKVSIDTNGNMIINGDLKVLGTVDTQKLNVSQAVAGTTIIVAGTNEITMLNDNIKEGSLIFVTPTSPTKNNIYVKSQEEGQAIIGFDTEVPTLDDIKFNWWIVGISN